MYVSGNDFCNSSGQEVPYDYSAIVTADGQKGSVAVEGASYRQRYAVQGAIELFGIILTERF